ncbi:MAG: methyltransferase domain-containing protein [Bryobacterales bacterium]|nr:methyltransferase domain-containing protein [Bryobacterales bacterium]
MADAESRDTLAGQEIVEIAREIRERVRARYPDGAAGGAALPDLLPILHARDAAQAKVAAIGSVNPRPPGLVNSVAQALKKTVARLLDWHVREQIEFNRSVVAAIEAVLEALNENNRALVRLAGIEREAKAREAALRAEIETQAAECRALREEMQALLAEARELKDVRSHWAQWRQEWEQKLSINEVQFLRSVADLEAASQLRASSMETSFRDLTRSQHKDFTLALERTGTDIQKRLWADLDKVRTDFERLIHAELRLIRQRAAAGTQAAASPAPPPAPEPALDWLWFAERFRGSAEYVREKQRFYVPYFQDCGFVADLGCGRGEFLGLMREAGIQARGVDLSGECVALCRSLGLEAEKADLFEFLAGLPDAALDGVFSAQVIEHLPPERVPELIRLAAAKLRRGGLLALETPNPECLAALAVHFFLDPTHSRPVPAGLARFYMEECGFGGIEVHPLTPAIETMPSLASIPEDFRASFFDGLDYAILGRKL